MPHEVSVRTAHAGLASLLREWLDDARLALPRPVTLVVEVGPLPLSPSDSRDVFRQGNVAIRSGPPIHTVSLDWEPRLGRAVLAPQSTAANVIITEQGLQRENEMLRSFLLNVCILLVRRVGLHHVHAAALRDPHGRGWLLAGTSGSGKSTTTALFARHGWGIGTDDIAFLAEGAAPRVTDVVCWRERLALHDDAVVAVGPDGGTPLTARRKMGWFPEELGAEWLSRITPQVILFPGAEHGDTTSLTPIKGREAVTRLMRWSPWVALEADFADEHLQRLSQLASQARAFEVTLGRDLFDSPDRLLELVS
ncbi:MAG: hypothetical protein HYX65_04110 [Gemmatimonadetes bacterium]|nr:hypothetical protein [Gemmatimonadota bacterium]